MNAAGLAFTARRMDRDFGRCLDHSMRVAESVEELDDMVIMSLLALRWLQTCCLDLKLKGAEP